MLLEVNRFYLLIFLPMLVSFTYCCLSSDMQCLHALGYGDAEAAIAAAAFAEVADRKALLLPEELQGSEMEFNMLRVRYCSSGTEKLQVRHRQY
jgi:hypothetical protein